MTEVLSLHFATAFKHAFSQPEIFQAFVHDVTGIDVNPERIHTEYEYSVRTGTVDTKYDIFAEDEQEQVIVGIQHIKGEDLSAHFLYHHLMSIIEQVAKHDVYEPPKRVITIVVQVSAPRNGNLSFSWGRHPMELLDEYDKRHQIASHELIFLNPRLVNESTPVSAKPWLELIKDSFDKQIDESNYESPIFKKLIHIIQKTNMNSDVSTAIKDESAWEMACRRFRQEGFEEGLKISREQIIERGRRQQQEETARAMLAEGIEQSIITLATGLTVSEIEALVLPVEA